MAFQTFDIPAELLNQAAIAAKRENIDLDEFVRRAIGLSLQWLAPAGHAGGRNSASADANRRSIRSVRRLTIQ